MRLITTKEVRTRIKLLFFVRAVAFFLKAVINTSTIAIGKKQKKQQLLDEMRLK